MSQPTLFNMTAVKDRVRLADTPLEKLKIVLDMVAKVPVPAGHIAPVHCQKCGEAMSVTRGQRTRRLMIYHPTPTFKTCDDAHQWVAEGEEAEELYRQLTQLK